MMMEPQFVYADSQQSVSLAATSAESGSVYNDTEMDSHSSQSSKTRKSNKTYCN